MDKIEQRTIITKTLGLAVFISLITSIAMILVYSITFIKTSKLDKKLSKKLKEVLNDGKDWKVYIMKSDQINAFAIVKPNVFLTSKVLEVMNERQVMAIMLHEASHINNKDIISNIIKKHAILSVIFAAMVAATGVVSVYLLALLFVLFKVLRLSDKVFTIVFGRINETRADSYAVKYGYGKDLAEALQMLNASIKQEMQKQKCGSICKFANKISEILDEHPPIQKRIENILQKEELWRKTEKSSFSSTKKFLEDELTK